MAKFIRNKAVVQANPEVKVDVSRENPLPVGANRFELVVVDDSGNHSEPAVLEVIVKDVDRPTAVLDVVDASNTPTSPSIGFGRSFILSGQRSTDLPPGKIKEYRFTLLGRV